MSCIHLNSHHHFSGAAQVCKPDASLAPEDCDKGACEPENKW